MHPLIRAARALVAVAALAGAAAQRAAAQPAPAQPGPAQPAPADSAGIIAVIPRPTQVTPRPGRFTLTARTVIWTDSASAAVGRQLARYVEPATGFALAVRTGGARRRPGPWCCAATRRSRG
jgi:hypothetical protein